jgi:hypothetical protein
MKNRSTALPHKYHASPRCLVPRVTLTSMSGSERTQRYRARQHAGLVMVSLAIEPVAIGEWLVDCGFLEAWDAADLSAVQAALQDAVAVWSRV